MDIANQISNAEWEIIRIIWAHPQVTSRAIIDYAVPITGWKEGTIKTLINRLVNKNFIAPMTTTRPYKYEALITEEEATHQEITTIFRRICAKDASRYIARLIADTPIKKDDCQQLIQLISDKMATAPEEVQCSCPKGQCTCQSHT